MSMQVDYNSPLNEQERKYLLERGKYDEVTRVDSLHGVETPQFPTGDGTGPELQGTTMVDRQNQRIAELERQLALARGESSDGATAEEDEELSPYEEWNVAELDAELKRRKLPVKGTKDDKVTALYDNDDVTGA